MSRKTTYTHAELVKLAGRWLRTRGCAVVITEMAGGSQEPDAIGWNPRYSILVECKVSRSDFLSDKNKGHQRIGKSMGDTRYYLAPPGIITCVDLPKKWGLLEPYRNGVKIVRYVDEFFQEKDWRNEITLLISAFRRVRGVMPDGVSAKFYEYETKSRATVGIGREEG